MQSKWYLRDELSDEQVQSRVKADQTAQLSHRIMGAVSSREPSPHEQEGAILDWRQEARGRRFSDPKSVPALPPSSSTTTTPGL